MEVILTLNLHLYTYKALCVSLCLSVNPLKTRERVGRLPPNFRVALGRHVDGFRRKTTAGSCVGGQKIYTSGGGLKR